MGACNPPTSCGVTSVPLCCGLYLQTWKELYYSEEKWDQLKEAASCARIMKVEVNVFGSYEASDLLAISFMRNKVIREVTLSCVPVGQVESLKRTLSMNTALTTVVVE